METVIQPTTQKWTFFELTLKDETASEESSNCLAQKRLIL